MTVGEFRLKLYPYHLDAMRHFYVEVLGFTVLHEWHRAADDWGVMLKVGNITLELLAPEGEYRPLSGFGFSIEVDDVAQLWEEYKSSESVGHQLRHNSWGDMSFSLLDPEGIEVCFFTKY